MNYIYVFILEVKTKRISNIEKREKHETMTSVSFVSLDVKNDPPGHLPMSRRILCGGNNVGGLLHACGLVPVVHAGVPEADDVNGIVINAVH